MASLRLVDQGTINNVCCHLHHFPLIVGPMRCRIHRQLSHWIPCLFQNRASERFCAALYDYDLPYLNAHQNLLLEHVHHWISECLSKQKWESLRWILTKVGCPSDFREEIGSFVFHHKTGIGCEIIDILAEFNLLNYYYHNCALNYLCSSYFFTDSIQPLVENFPVHCAHYERMDLFDYIMTTYPSHVQHVFAQMGSCCSKKNLQYAQTKYALDINDQTYLQCKFECIGLWFHDFCRSNCTV